MKKIYSLLLLVCVLLSACGNWENSPEQILPPSQVTETAQVLPGTEPAEPPDLSLNMDSDPETIRLKMLHSYRTWVTLFVDATHYWGGSAESGQATQTFHEQVWIDQSIPAFRQLSGPVDGEAETFRNSDGQTLLDWDLKTGATQTQSLPDFVRDPYDPPLTLSDTLYPHPLSGQMGSSLSDLLLPSGLAQREGTFENIGLETIAGRMCLVVDWVRPDGSRPSRYWLDVETGVILRAQGFSKQGGESIQDETITNTIAYNAVFYAALFSVMPAEVPQWSNASGAPLGGMSTPAPTIVGGDPLGEVYFFAMDMSVPVAETHLVRLPGSCVMGLTPCPVPERIETPVALVFSLQKLVWSPDGNLAAFTYSFNEEGTRTGLFTFAPDTTEWKQLAEYNYVDSATWSSDGSWIAFRVQDGEGNSDYYAIHPDGSGLVNLTQAKELPVDGNPYVMDGWTSNYVILRSGKPGQEGTVYLVRVYDRLVRPLFETQLTKAAFLPSPDGSLLAYDDYDYETHKHVIRVIAPDGSGLRDLATFMDASIFPLVWSPDIESLAFSVNGVDGGGSSDVYVMRRDGREMAQVYRGKSVTDLMFSPDGTYILVADMDAIGEHLFVVNLETLEIHMLQAPGLSLNWRWLMPSWRP